MNKKDIQIENMMENAADFLLFSYFEKSLEELNLKENIIKAAVEKAYDDATLLGAYKYKHSTYRDKSGEKAEVQNGNNNKFSDDAKNKCVKYLTDDGAIEKLISATSQSAYDKLHKIICGELVDKHKRVRYKKYKKDKETSKYVSNGKEYLCFTYGNAQKWINMTTKNLYVLAGMCIGEKDYEVKKFCEQIIECSPYFHIPIDQFVLNVLRDDKYGMKDMICSKGEGIKYYQKNNIDDETCVAVLDGSDCKKNDYSFVKKSGYEHKAQASWSTIGTYKLYVALWKEIKEAIAGEIPIEWECKNWPKGK